MSTTSFDEFYSRFYDKVENDPDFFDYYNHTSDESMEIAQERAKSYLNEAIDWNELSHTRDFSRE